MTRRLCRDCHENPFHTRPRCKDCEPPRKVTWQEAFAQVDDEVGKPVAAPISLHAALAGVLAAALFAAWLFGVLGR